MPDYGVVEGTVNGMGSLERGLRSELEQTLLENERQLGSVYRLEAAGLAKNTDFVSRGAAANTGAVSNLRYMIRAILNGEITRSPSVARQTVASINTLRRENPDLSPEAREHLDLVTLMLNDVSKDETAQRTEDKAAVQQSEKLETSLVEHGGVYVYTLPLYYRVPIKEDPERFWLKIGMTKGAVSKRVADQQRITGLPEDPWLMRVYRSSQHTPDELEKAFHRILEAAGHHRAFTKRGGTEWFATNLEFLDAFARALDLHVEELELPE